MAKSHHYIHSIFDASLGRAKDILGSPARFSELLDDVMHKMHHHELLRPIAEKVMVFVRLLKAYQNKQYHVPWSLIVSAVAVLLYIVMPLDAIADFVPVVGYIDDITVVTFVVNKFNTELEDFRKWEEMKLYESRHPKGS